MATRAQRKGQATIDAILDAAQALMAEAGTGAVTLEAISERADVAVQTIYNRVGGRLAVLLGVAQRALQTKRGYLDAAYRGRGTALERLREIGAAYVRFAVERPHEFQLLAFPPAGVPAQELGQQLFSEHIDILAGLIRDGIDAGQFNPHLDPRIAAIALWRTYDGVLSLALRPDMVRMPLDELPALLGTVQTLIENGLHGTPPPAPPAG